MLVSKLPDFIENRLMEEYRELGLCWRHDDDWIAKLGAVLLPLSIAALTLPHLKQGAPNLLCAIGGLSLMTFWYLSSRICKRRFEIRFSRIHQIEGILGLDSHLRYKRKSAKKVLKHRRLRFWMFAGYIAIALCDTLDLEPDKLFWPSDWEVFASAITAETILFLAIPIVAVTVVCVCILLRIYIPIGCKKIFRYLVGFNLH